MAGKGSLPLQLLRPWIPAAAGRRPRRARSRLLLQTGSCSARPWPACQPPGSMGMNKSMRNGECTGTEVCMYWIRCNQMSVREVCIQVLGKRACMCGYSRARTSKSQAHLKKLHGCPMHAQCTTPERSPMFPLDCVHSHFCKNRDPGALDSCGPP